MEPKNKMLNSGTHFQEIEALVHMIFKPLDWPRKEKFKCFPPKTGFKIQPILKQLRRSSFKMKTTPTELRAARFARLRAAERPAAQRAAEFKK
jgi:hypothetical protein